MTKPTCDEVNQLLSAELDAYYAARGRIDTLTLKALGMTLLARYPEAVFLTLADGDQSDTGVFADGLLDSAGTALDFDPDDDEVSDLVHGLVNYRLDDSDCVETIGSRRHGEWKVKLAEAAALDMPGVNTTVTYMYRDASNYKQSATAVFAGQITALERATIMAALEPDVHFIPGQVELANLQERFGDWTDDDHPWHELVDIAVDRSPVTENGTIHEWAARFAAIIWEPIAP